MRKHYNNILKKFFWLKLIKSRAKMHLTQAQMSRKLIMEERSYIELDHGNACCSALTLALFLIYCCEDPMQFLAELKVEFEKAKQDIA